MSETYGTFATAYVEAMRLRLAALESENKDLRARFSDADTERNAAQAALKAAFARVAELEARCKRLEEAGDALLGGVPASFQGAWRAAKEAKP